MSGEAAPPEDKKEALYSMLVEGRSHTKVMIQTQEGEDTDADSYSYTP